MSIKIFSNNSSLDAQEELDIVNSRSYNLGNTNYYVDSKTTLECINPYIHGATSITLCESISDNSIFSIVEDNCRKLIESLGDTDVSIDISCVRLLSRYRTVENFKSNIKAGYDVDLSVKDQSVEYIENTSEEYPRSTIKKRGPNLNPKPMDRNQPFRKIFHGGNDFRNVPYTKAPYSSAVMIMEENTRAIGSGVFISPRVILTCRHNFYNDDGTLVVGKYSYIQGSNSPTNGMEITSGTKTLIDTSKIEVFPGTYKVVSPTDMVAVVVETPCEISYVGGTYSEIITNYAKKNNLDISIIGYPYPGDTPEVKDRMKNGYLYESTGTVSGYNDEGTMRYSIDTLGGNSGSGVFNNGKVVGIHVGGLAGDANYAVDIDKAKTDWIREITTRNITNGWYEFDGKRYYYMEDIMIRGKEHKMDGKIYTFDENGVLVDEKDNPDSDPKNGSGADNGSGKKSSTTVGNNGTHLWRFNDFAMWNGDTKQGSTNSSVRNDLNNSGNSSSNGNNSSPSNTGQLAGKLKEAVASALDSSNWNALTDGGNPGIDVDGAYGAQCFDLANYYMEQLGVGWDRTKVDAWGDFNFPLQYKSQFESLGWKLIEYPSFSQLVVGAITFENNQGVGLGEIDSGGHTEMITSIEGTSISFLTQNPNSPTIMTIDSGGEPIGWGYRIQLIAVPPS